MIGSVQLEDSVTGRRAGGLLIPAGGFIDALPLPGQDLPIFGSIPTLWNGQSIDKQRGNFDTGALITHSGATVGVNGGDQQNVNARGLQLVIDITAITGSLTVTIEGKDQASGKYYTLLASAALAAVATTVLRIYPGLTAAANLVANDVLSRTWRVRSTIVTGPVTATIGASLIL